VAELGRGQHSVVYKAWQQSLRRHVALKVLRRSDERTLRKFQTEARLTARLVEDWVPNIRQIYEVGRTADGALFVVMEYVTGSLRSVMDRAQASGRVMGAAAAAELLRPVAEALDTIHGLGWTHLDIKPQNILISKAGRAVLADFGIAQRRGSTTHACTPAYASPEQAAGDRPVGPWSDIYSLGVVLYEMVTGQPPVRGDQDMVLLSQHLSVPPPSPRATNPSLSADQERAILKALAKPPAERYQNATELIQDLVEPRATFSRLTMLSSILVPNRSYWGRRIPLAVLIGATVVLFLSLLIVAVWALWPRAVSGPPLATSAPPATEMATGVASDQPSATEPASPAPTVVPSETVELTATLAPTSTRTPKPTATNTPFPTLDPTYGIGTYMPSP
jgi:serine/threonine-protein kinase